MAQGSKPRTSRPRNRQAAAAALTSLQARRDELDQAAAERRRREDDLLNEYATDVVAELYNITTREDARVEELMAQVARTHTEADEARAAIATRRAIILANLADLGRSADELATVLALPTKRVRQMIREGHEHLANGSSTPATESATAITTKAVKSRPVDDTAAAHSEAPSAAAGPS